MIYDTSFDRGLPFKIPNQVCLDPENYFQWTNERLDGCQDLSLCVSFMFGLQRWSPCNGIIIPSLRDVNKKKFPGPKNGDNLIAFKGT